MSYKITRESTNLFIKMALPNLLDENFKASGKDFYVYVNDTAHQLQISRPTMLNWMSGETMPDAADFTFLCWKMNIAIKVNDNGYFELTPADSIISNQNKPCSDIPTVSKG